MFLSKPFIYFYGLLLLLITSCVEPYKPDIIQAPHNILVVSGFINSNGPTVFRLTRTQNLDGTNIPPAEKKAKLFVEEEQGTQTALLEQTDGSYTGNVVVNNLKKYRLRIKTADNNEYQSDYVEAKTVPPIENLRWEAVDNTLNIYVNTRDAQQKTRYYRWDYEETWEFKTPFYAEVEYKNGKVEPRLDNINRCWRGAKSGAVHIASSLKLSQDVISDYPLIKLGSNSTKLPIKYSVLVKQYALTPEAYAYFEILKKNTESIGTLFDPLPSQITGNIHGVTNKNEPVIGFVTATSVQEKRIFISRAELPRLWVSDNEYRGCLPDTIGTREVVQRLGSGMNLPISGYQPNGVLIGYIISDLTCVDCRVRGTNVQPPFWQ